LQPLFGEMRPRKGVGRLTAAAAKAFATRGSRGTSCPARRRCELEIDIRDEEKVSKTVMPAVDAREGVTKGVDAATSARRKNIEMKCRTSNGGARKPVVISCASVGSRTVPSSRSARGHIGSSLALVTESAWRKRDVVPDRPILREPGNTRSVRRKDEANSFGQGAICACACKRLLYQVKLTMSIEFAAFQANLCTAWLVTRQRGNR